MGAFIARQPNGLYCRYSTYVDGFTHLNLTEEDVIEMYKKSAEDDAIYTMNKASEIDEYGCWFNPQNRQHLEELNGVLESIGSSIRLKEENYDFIE